MKIEIETFSDFVLVNGKKYLSKTRALKEITELLQNTDFQMGKISGKKIKIFCVETGEYFKSAKDAEKTFNLVAGTVARCAGKYKKNGKLRAVKGLHFERIDR